MKKLISMVFAVTLFLTSGVFLACAPKTEEPPVYNTECDFVFFIRYNSATKDYYFRADITNNTGRTIAEIRDLYVEIDFGDDITAKIRGRDIEETIKAGETVHCDIDTYSLRVGLGRGDIDAIKASLKEYRPSISYAKQTYNLLYGLI